MITAIIIDDELPCIAALQHDLKMFCPQVKVIAACQSAKEGLLAIRAQGPDLVFLDIEMPVINGFELLQMLGGDIGFQLIFTTAYEQFAIRAFKVSAMAYLLKPVGSEELIEAVARVQRNLAQRGRSEGQIGNLLENNRLSPEEQKIAFPNREGYDFVSPADIVYCQADGAYTRVVMGNGRSLLLSKPLGETESLLPSSLFERIHHSCLINITQVQQYKKTDGASIVMQNGDRLNVARSKKARLMYRLGIR